ncbi:MAG: nuclear transport factor 2 family protein [Gammaproteobacteria bacterium]|nr:nuclear transport factor 2 family protein [Gammaproteobacteria bacterium]
MSLRLTPVLLALLALLAGCAITSPAEDDMLPQEMPTALVKAAEGRPQSALDAEITAFLARYADAYNRQDYKALLELWDREDPDVFYIAEEIDPPMQGWKLIDAYFARPGVLDGIRNEYSRVRAHYLAPDLALATYFLRFDIKVKNMKALSGFDRVVAVFRKRDGEWKMAAYAEAPQAPLTMVRKLAQQSKMLTPEETKAMLNTIKTMQEVIVPADFAAYVESQSR